MTKVAVVILNYNGEKFLQQFLPSVLHYSKEAAIVVADNASTDKSLKILATEFPTVRVISLTKNYGFCGGYNRALKEITADYYVLLNSDVEVTEGWLESIIQLMEEDKQIAAVQPKIKSYHQKNHFEYAGAAGGFLDSLGYPFCRGRLFDVIEEDTGQYNDVCEIFWATGACMVVRASVYNQLEGLDEDFFAHMEEIDLCWRMKQAGYKIYYQGNSTVYHVGGGTLSKVNPRKTFLNFRNGLYLITKNMELPHLLWKLPLRLLLDYIAAIRFFLTGQGTHGFAILKAHYAFARNLIMMCKKRKKNSGQSHRNKVTLYRRLIIWDFYILRKKKVSLP